MQPSLVASLLASVFNGGAVTVVWIIGIILIIGGVVTLFRGSVLLGIVLIVIGVLLGGLNVF
jgi:hypothetical protein